MDHTVTLETLRHLLPDAGQCVLCFALLSAGAAAGLLAGLFGIGGGTMIVPVLYETFGWFTISDDVRMPLCVGTSLAIIIPTSIMSFLTHWRRGSVDREVLRAWFVPVLLGAFAGSLVAQFAPSAIFKLTFIAIALITAARLLWSERIPCLMASLPGARTMVGYGLTIGASSALMGIGGGLVANVVMALHGRNIHQIVATSSGIGVLVSLPATVGYIIAGWHNVELPPYSLGFVSALGFLILMPTSLAMAKVGASLAHSLSKVRLERAFAAYLSIVSLRFAWSLLVP